MKYLLVVFLVFALKTVLYGQDKDSCELVVHVEKIKKLKGSIKVAIYNKEALFLSQALRTRAKKVSASNESISFKGLDEGMYAVSIFHDVNDNDKLDVNFIGIPSEPYGFSNNAKGMFGPPDYEDCVFKIEKSSHKIVISL